MLQLKSVCLDLSMAMLIYFWIFVLQNELEYGADEPPMSPRLPFQNQHSQNAMHPSNLGAPGSFSPLGISVVGQGVRTGQSDNQAKNSVFSNALSSPVRRSIQSYQLSQVGYHSNHISSYGNGPRNNETNPSNLQNRDTNSPSSNDCMDMHADSPGHDYSYWNYLLEKFQTRKRKRKMFSLLKCLVWSEALWSEMLKSLEI